MLLLLFFSFTNASVQDNESSSPPKKIFTFIPHISAEFLSQKIRWDEESLINPVREEDITRLKSFLLTLSITIKFSESLSVSPFVGYSLSNFDALTFRELPFSVELDTGYKNGLLFGTELRGDFFSLNHFTLSGQGLFHYCLGLNKTWEIPTVNTPGTLEGKPDWMRINIGPILTYKGIQYLYPYAGISFNRVWGKYKASQIVGLLSSEEERKFKSRSVLCAAIGVLYEMTDFFHVTGEVKILPHGGGLDFSFLLKASYIH